MGELPRYQRSGIAGDLSQDWYVKGWNHQPGQPKDVEQNSQR
jgi:hypothetical protein